jgi:hypothetical protein
MKQKFGKKNAAGCPKHCKSEHHGKKDSEICPSGMPECGRIHKETPHNPEKNYPSRHNHPDLSVQFSIPEIQGSEKNIYKNGKLH